MLSIGRFIDPGTSGGDATDSQAQFALAMVTVMDTMGSALPAVHWSVSHSTEGPVMCGTIEGPTAIQSCLAWAAVFLMTEYTTTRDDGGRQWVAANGPWRIELIGVTSE